MADKKQDFPVRVINTPRSVPVADSPWFPATAAAVRSARDDMGTAYAKGDTAAALGASARQVATVPLGLAYDALAAPIYRAAGGVGHFLRGAVGLNNASEAVNRQPVAVAPAAAVGDQMLAAGRAAPAPPVTARDQLNEFLNSVMTRGATVHELAQLGPLVEGTPKPRTAKDVITGTAAGAADASFQAALSAADKETDPAKKDLARQKAADTYFTRYATLSGANTQPLTMQDFLENQGK